MFKTIGIIGYGAFGKVLASKLSNLNCDLLVSDDKAGSDKSVNFVTTDELVKRSDLVILAVPFTSYDDLLVEIKPHLKEGAIVMDVCSVKTLPLKKLRSELPGFQILATHPLFGPESSEDACHVVLCSESDELAAKFFEEISDKLNWKIIEMSADEHDREMALVHGLTFFVAESLTRLELPTPSIPTGFYEHLNKLIQMQRKHTAELTLTIEKYNPYAAEVRQKFLEKAAEVDDIFKS